MKINTLFEISKAIIDLAENYEINKNDKSVEKPISHSLHQTWEKWNKIEKPRKTKR